jgi:GNAT superfamily N-acetyltransferase
MDPGNEDYFISTDRELLDLDFICGALAGSYWAQNRPRPVVEKSIRNSVCFGLYERRSRRQVGFARLVTDGATFSWLADVIVDERHRGKGLGKLLVSTIVDHPLVSATTCLLGTRDAHGLYERFGFTRSEMMRRLRTGEQPSPAPMQAPDVAPPSGR